MLITRLAFSSLLVFIFLFFFLGTLLSGAAPPLGDCLSPESYTVAKVIPFVVSDGLGSHSEWVECHVFIFS